jgi:hypothetical protein
LVAFRKKNPPALKPLMSRVWWCRYHPTVKSCWVLVYSALLQNCCAGVVDRVDDDKWWHHGRPPVMLTVALLYFISTVFQTLNLYFMSWTMVCNNLTLRGNLDLNWCLHSGLAFVWVLMHMFDPLYELQVIYQALTRQLTTGWYFTIA